MKITFVLPFVAATGGVRAVLRHAAGLRARRHEVVVVFPMWPYAFHGGPGTPRGLRMWAGTLRANLTGAWRGSIDEAATAGVRMVPEITDAHLPDADVVVATAWPTANSVAALGESKGRKAYIVQHREHDSGPAAEVDATLRLPLARFAGSIATAEELKRELGVEVSGFAPSGVDVAFWSAGAPSERQGVVMMATGAPHKGLDDGLSALHRVRAARPRENLTLFGARRPLRAPVDARFVERPNDEALRTLYQRAAVLLYPSRSEGFGLPPLEAMASGCAVVTTRVGAVPEFSRNQVSALWVEPGDVEGMARLVMTLLDDPARRAALAAGGRADAAKFDWSLSTARFAEGLERLARG